MGACCGTPNANQVDQGLAKSPLKQSGGALALHGDYFSSEVRTIVASLQYCGVAFTFKEVNTLIG